MGAWGIGLYQDDMALDIRDTVKDELRFGTPLNEIITQLKLNYDIDKYDNNDEESVFWCALADTLWQLGRLDDKIKNKALSYIERGADIERWMSEDSRLALKREKVFQNLKAQLLSQQPLKKILSKQRIYVCPWEIGDVFAVKLHGEMAQRKEISGTYLLFQVADKYLYSISSNKAIGHICPIVRSKLTLSKNVPELNDFVDNQIIKTEFFCDINKKNVYSTLIYTTSSKVIPKDLIFLGNKELVIPKDDYGMVSDDINDNAHFTLWKKFENDMVKYYYGHNLKQFSIYHEEN